jgi:small subunit ribosomal protein S18
METQRTSSAGGERRPRREGGSGGRRQFFRRRKVCKFCEQKIGVVDYKDARLLGEFVSERGKILPRRLTGTCARHQHVVALAIKRARNIALLPFASVL